MGMPLFYKWLVGKYPNIVVSAKEVGGDAGEGPVSGIYHNLYLDMNGIIHPCFHPEDQVTNPSHEQSVYSIVDGLTRRGQSQVCPPTTFDEVFQAMFEYMDRLFRIVRPTKLLYLAVGTIVRVLPISCVQALELAIFVDLADLMISYFLG
jgi:5'-3' exonuclease